MRSDQGAGSLYALLYNRDPSYRDVWDAFADETNVKANEIVH